MPLRLVVDTNVFVSALLSPSGKPASVLNLILAGRVTPVADALVFAEYFDVLTRPRFGFSKEMLSFLASTLRHSFQSVSPLPLPCTPLLPDPDDEKFLAVALGAGGVPLVTGNRKHFPVELLHTAGITTVQILSPDEFLARFFAPTDV